jgi:hypothetical protein
VSPTKVIRRAEPLPTTIDEGMIEFDGRNKETLPESGVVWLKAPESATQSVMAG